MWRTSVGNSDTGTVNYTGTSARQFRGPSAMLPAPRASKRKTEESDGAETAAAARKKPLAAERELARKDAETSRGDCTTKEGHGSGMKASPVRPLLAQEIAGSCP